MAMDSLRFDLNYPVDEDQEYMSVGYEKRFEDISKDFFLSENISFLSNEFQFAPIQTALTDKNSYKNDINDLKRTFLYYDRPKSQRITKNEVKRILSKNLRAYSLSNLEKKPNTVKSDFSQEPIFDFKVGDKYIKAISFDYAHKTTMATELKSTLYDLNKIISENSVSDIVITTNDDYNSDSFETFSKQIDNIQKTAKQTKIKIVPLSEFYQVLNN